jgi:dienelactone hydrolase
VNGTKVDVEAADGTADSYLTRPGDGRSHPGVLLLVDAFGLRPQIEAMADRIAAAYPDRVAGLGCFHTGGLVSDGEDSPHLSAAAIEAELYLGFADRDKSATPAQIATVEDALCAAGKQFRAEVYAGAEHGYTMADTPAYDEAAAERHHAELAALLARTVGA